MDSLEQEVRELVERLLSDDHELVETTLGDLLKWISPYEHYHQNQPRRKMLFNALLEIVEEESARSQRIIDCMIRQPQLSGHADVHRERRIPWKFRIQLGIASPDAWRAERFRGLIGCHEGALKVDAYRQDSSVPAFTQEPDPEAALLEAVQAIDPFVYPALAGTVFAWTFKFSESWPWPATIEKIRQHLLKETPPSFGSMKKPAPHWLWYARMINGTVKYARDRYRSGILKRPPEKQQGVPSALRVLLSLFSYSLRDQKQAEWAVAIMNRRGSGLAMEMWDELDWLLKERLQTVAKPCLDVKRVAQAREALRSAPVDPEVIAERTDRVPWFITDTLDNIKTVLELGRDVSSAEAASLQALHDSFLRVQQQREREEQRRKAEAEAEEARRVARRELYEKWQELIAGRCSHIVTVFNGVFGLTIDPDSVLSGQVTGEYASINSAGPSLGMSMTLSLRLVQELHCRTETWLKIEEGDDLAEWRSAYTAGNCLVWHELAHLMDTGLIRTILKKHLPGDTTPEVVLQARELALDAVAFRLATEIYVHPGGAVRHCTQADERREVMLQSIEAQVDRLRRWIESEPESIGRSCLITRFLVQLETHELTKNRRRLAGLIEGQDKLRKLYAAIYADALMIGVLSQAFHSTVQTDDAEESEFFTGMAKSA